MLQPTAKFADGEGLQSLKGVETAARTRRGQYEIEQLDWFISIPLDP